MLAPMIARVNERPGGTAGGTDGCEHLDSIFKMHHDAIMRTTVTLDKDVELLLREAMHRSRQSFKQTLNAAVRAALTGRTVRPKTARFVVKARPMGVRAGVDPAGFNKLADELEVDGLLGKTQRARS